MRRSLEDLLPEPGRGRAFELAVLDESEASIPRLTRLNNEAFKEHYNYRPVTEEEMRFMLAAMRHENMELMTYVARMKGEPVGFLALGINPREIKQRGRKLGGLYQVGVLKPFRGQGIATRLMIAGMNWLKSKGMEEAELGVDDTNPTRAIRLYEKLGFTVVRKYVHFRKNLAR